MKTFTTNKRLIIFLVLVFIFTYVFEFLVITPIAKQEGYDTSTTVKGMVAIVMFLPALSALLTRLITKEGFGNSMIKPNFKGNHCCPIKI